MQQTPAQRPADLPGGVEDLGHDDSTVDERVISDEVSIQRSALLGEGLFSVEAKAADRAAAC